MIGLLESALTSGVGATRSISAGFFATKLVAGGVTQTSFGSPANLQTLENLVKSAGVAGWA